MVGPGRRLDPASEADLRKALGLARAVSRNYASMALTTIDCTQAEGLPFSTADLKLIAEAQRRTLTALRPTSIGNPDAISGYADRWAR